MKSTTKDMAFIALSTTIIIVCSFITIPFYVPFTMQTFAFFVVLGLLGFKKTFLSTCLYLFLGIIGLPVFSGFRGGIGHLLGPTGGFLLGFLPMVMVSGTLLYFFSKKHRFSVLRYVISMFSGLLVCYGFGTLWYLFLYTNSTESLSLTSVLSLCVFPFIFPDMIKIFLASYVVKYLKKHISKF